MGWTIELVRRRGKRSDGDDISQHIWSRISVGRHDVKERSMLARSMNDKSSQACEHDWQLIESRGNFCDYKDTKTP